MLIGITYDLREDYLAQGFSEEDTAEFDAAVTIDGIDEALRALGHRTVRVGPVFELVPRLARGERWDMVFNIAEGLAGFARESQVPAILEAYQIPCTFSDPMVLAVALHKGVAKRILRDSGVPTPDFAVVETPEDAARIALPCSLFAKPVAEGTSKGITLDSLIDAPEKLVPTCTRLLERFNQPVLVERYLPGREFTVGVAGTGERARSLGVMEVFLGEKADQGVYSYDNKEEYEDRVTYALADDAPARDAARVAVAAWRALGCRDAGRVDVRLDEEGRASVMELNPLPGLNPLRSDLPILCGKGGISYRELIRIIVESAAERLPAPGAKPFRWTPRHSPD